jgi:predicted NAD/FAD-binding protein
MNSKIAIVGSGISGLSCAYLLARSDCSVTVYEANSYVGGHTNTVNISSLDGSQEIGVDTGFIVCNPVTYPNFLAFMDHLGVLLHPSDMSFAVSRDNGQFEWSGDNLDTLFAQRSNLLNPKMYLMIHEILRFHEHAMSLAKEADEWMLKTGNNQHQEHPLSNVTLGEFFKTNGYSPFFYENYVLPMTASIWSCPPEMTFNDFPLVTLVRFMRNHMLLQIGGRPKWKTVKLGSKTYVDQILQTVKDVRTDTRVLKVERPDDSNSNAKVKVYDSTDNVQEFDHIVFAVHGDQILEILKDSATADEREILSKFKFVKVFLRLYL